MSITVFYDGHDEDGFTSAWLASKYLKVDQFIPCPRNFIPADVKDSIVYLLDLCFGKKNMTKIISKAKKVIVYDHHKTAIPVLEHLSKKFDKNKFEYVCDVNKCAAMITLEQLHIGQKPTKYLKFVSYVQDKDLWVWKQSFSREVDAYFKLFDFTFENWNHIFDELNNNFDKIVETGTIVLRYRQRLIDKIIEMAAQKGKDNVMTVNSPVLQSEIGNQLASKAKYVKIWHINDKDNESVSLRSVGDLDVSEIAKEFGGGGHKNAAGYQIKKQ